jgi:hypothetical protein
LDVVTLDPGSLPSVDWTRLAGLPGGMRVYGVASRAHPAEHWERLLARLYHRARPPAFPPANPLPHRASSDGEAFALAGLVARQQLRWRSTALRDYVRAFEAWLDFARDGAWSQAAGRTALRLAQAGVHRAVVTSGPPHMVHQAGRLVSRRTGLAHIIDMRDPWSLVPALPTPIASPVWLWLAARYERSAVERAALVVTNTEPFRSAMQALYPGARGRIVTVMNGCDEEQVSSASSARRFTIAYAGSIYIDRNPRLIFRAAAQVVRDLKLTPEQFGFDFVGHVDQFAGVPLAVIAQEEGLEGYVRTRAALPRQEVLAVLAQAPMLLTLPQDIRLCIPSKVFEYMQFNAWLLALAKRDSATELLLRGTAADVVEPEDVPRIAEVVRTRYLQFARGERPTRVATNGRFSRRAQAQVLFDALEACVASAATTR